VLDDFNQTPPFQLRKRARLHNADGVSDLSFALLVVDIEPLYLLDDLAEPGMWHAGGGFDDGGLVHFRGHDLTDALLAEAPLGRFGLCSLCIGLGHVTLLGSGRAGLLVLDRFHPRDLAAE
jgi:hypothetical protein